MITTQKNITTAEVNLNIEPNITSKKKLVARWKTINEKLVCRWIEE